MSDRWFVCRSCGEQFPLHPGACPLCSWLKRVRDEFAALVEHGEDLGSLAALVDDSAWLPSQAFTLRSLGGRPA